MFKKQLFPVAEKKKPRKCLACGSDNIKPGRRYCSKECRQRMMWVLSLSKGLLQTLNTRYATFSFTDYYVALDIMPTWSQRISRFIYERKLGFPPATSLKELVLQAGSEWYRKRSQKVSRSFASQLILEENIEYQINPDTIRPSRRKLPRLSRDQRRALKNLSLDIETLVFEDRVGEIRKAYRRLAKMYHPDTGGDGELFKELNHAHEIMLQWTENPQFQDHERLSGCWFYNGYTNKWSPPLSH